MYLHQSLARLAIAAVAAVAAVGLQPCSGVDMGVDTDYSTFHAYKHMNGVPHHHGLNVTASPTHDYLNTDPARYTPRPTMIKYHLRPVMVPSAHPSTRRSTPLSLANQKENRENASTSTENASVSTENASVSTENASASTSTVPDASRALAAWCAVFAAVGAA